MTNIIACQGIIDSAFAALGAQCRFIDWRLAVEEVNTGICRMPAPLPASCKVECVCGQWQRGAAGELAYDAPMRRQLLCSATMMILFVPSFRAAIGLAPRDDDWR